MNLMLLSNEAIIRNMQSSTATLKQMIANISILTIAALTIIYLCGMLFALLYADKMIFPYDRPHDQDLLGTVKLQSSHGDTISAVYYPTAKRSDHIVLYSHGNNHDLVEFLPILEDFQAHGYSILCYDYPGYGTSSGTASEASIYAAADAAYKYVTESLGYAPNAISLYGCSLGSGPATWLAQRYPVGRLIIEGGFTSTFRVMTKFKILPWDRFDNIARLPEVECPVLMIHAKQDEVIPFSHALQNFDAIRAPKDSLWLESAGHNNVVEMGGKTYWNKISDFTQAATSDRIAE